MKRITVLSIVLLSCLLTCFGQVSRDTITMKKVFGGYLFYQNDKKINMSQLVETMQPNEQAYKEIKKARSTYIISTIIGGAGGFMIGWPIGTALAGGDPEWIMAGIGAGLYVISIPITQKYNKQAKSAVGIYNGGFMNSTTIKKPELKLGFHGSQIGLTFRF